MTTKYLKLENLNPTKINNLKDIFEKLDISFKLYDYSTEAFFEEEAEFRLDMWEENNFAIEDTSLREDILSKLSDDFFNDDYIICGDALEDITDEVVNSFIKDNLSEKTL